MTKPTEPVPIAVTIESGPCAGRRVEVRTRQLDIGRDPDCGLSLPDDATVSRRHALLSWEDGHWTLRDLGSKNGTSLVTESGPEPVLRAQPVSPGQRWLVGSALIEMHAIETTPAFSVDQLRIVLSGGALRFEYASGAAAVEVWDAPWQETELKALHRELLACVLHGAAAGDNASGPAFQAICTRLGGLLLPEPLRGRLDASPGRPLLLLLDPALLDLPWEALTIAGKALCDRRPVSRQVLLGNAVRQAASRGSRCLLIADPTMDLPPARAAAESLLHNLTYERGLRQATFLAGGRATLARVSAELERHDAVLYLGHADHAADDPARSGWRLADGLLTPQRFAALQSVPALVIASACESAREGGRAEALRLDEGRAGAGATLLMAGVEQFVGTLWPVPVVSGAAIGAVLLEKLLDGNRMAEAMRSARRHAESTLGAAAMAYCAYVQYGLPDWRLSRRHVSEQEG